MNLKDNLYYVKSENRLGFTEIAGGYGWLAFGLANTGYVVVVVLLTGLH